MASPERAAREQIDKLLTAAGWVVCNATEANITGHRGVAIREFPLEKGHGFADYMLYVDGKAAGIVEAKKRGATLVGVEMQSAKYTAGLPDALPAWRRPLPFAYESTGVETRFTNGLEAAPRSRPVFAFHTPAMLAVWIADSVSAGDASAEASMHPRGAKSLRGGLGASAEASKVAEAAPEYIRRGPTFLARMQHMPPIEERGLWPAQLTAIENLEASLADTRPRSLILRRRGWSERCSPAVGTEGSDPSQGRRPRRDPPREFVTPCY